MSREFEAVPILGGLTALGIAVIIASVPRGAFSKAPLPGLLAALLTLFISARFALLGRGPTKLRLIEKK
jgi:hypothetical protein